MAAAKPTYEELEQRVKVLEQEAALNKQAERALRESEHNLNAHLQNTPIGAISWDLNFRAIEWNSAAEAIFGYSRAEAMGKHATELILPEGIKEMESVGRLAAGVAHDFNNALGVIISTEFALDDVEPTGQLREDLDEILTAAKRAADITRQLRAFARKQIIAPRVLDLNENVEIVLKMLGRLMGEDIDLIWLPGASLWPVKADASQIDQILVNLCINARDAIENVGEVTIETENLTLDEACFVDHTDFVSGEFVQLSVSDNGCGIGKEILDNIFEPFFTTKDIGKGIGLGLATVYGTTSMLGFL